MDISTLVGDIHDALGTVALPSCPHTVISANGTFLKNVGVREPKVRTPKTIYFSELGEPCLRKLWFKHYTPDEGEALLPATKIKFMYGDVLEGLVLDLASLAGHNVDNLQQEVEYVYEGWKVRGRIDATIDGVVVDVKSVTARSELKFHEGLTDDPFGYYGQLNGYATVLKNDQMGFLTIQKELGHINYFPFTPDPAVFGHGVARAINTLSKSAPPEAVLPPVPQSGTSPNYKLCTTCSYCPFKLKCFPTVRAFKYSSKVDFLTEVVVEPKVPEIPLK